MNYSHANLLTFLFLLLLFDSCIEPIEFEAGSEERRIVIDGMITNISYNDRRSLPQFPSKFNVRVQYTGPVDNRRNEPIPEARVILYDDRGASWTYAWDEEIQKFIMPFDDFKAVEGRAYHIEVTLPDGEVYKSAPEQLHVAEPFNEVTQELRSRIQEEDIGGEQEFKRQEGVSLYAVVPPPVEKEAYYLRYRVTPSWVYIAPVADINSPVKTCYVTNIYYFQKIITRMERTGGSQVELFFLETVNNLRVLHDFSAYVTQFSLSQEAYEFWDQVALQQSSGGNVFDPPPFELTTNLFNVKDEEEKVSGFFSVAHESSVRWYINESELPYKIVQAFEPCTSPPLPPQCSNCLEYMGGSSSITNVRPEWWRRY